MSSGTWRHLVLQPGSAITTGTFPSFFSISRISSDSSNSRHTAPCRLLSSYRLSCGLWSFCLQVPSTPLFVNFEDTDINLLWSWGKRLPINTAYLCLSWDRSSSWPTQFVALRLPHCQTCAFCQNVVSTKQLLLLIFLYNITFFVLVC